MLLLGKIKALFEIALTPLWLLGSSVHSRVRTKLLIGYLKFNKYFFRVFKTKAKNKIEEIEGYRVAFCDYSSLLFQFKEIFLRSEYYFQTDKRNPFIIDCGSNIGMSILFFKKLYPEAEIIGFEPDEETFRKLEENIRGNKLQNVRVHKKAVSDKEGVVNFFYDPDNPGSPSMSTIRERMPKECQVVESVSLSKFVNKAVDFLKLDVEGVETDVIRELYSNNKLSYIKEMAIEYHHHIRGEDDDFSTMLKMLEDSGFGYQIGGVLRRPFQKGKFQDILVYAYQK